MASVQPLRPAGPDDATARSPGPHTEPQGPLFTVVQFLSRLDSGHMEQATLEVANELRRRGHRSIVIAAPGRLLPYLTARGSEHIDWATDKGAWLAWRWVLRLRGLLVRERVDILHARTPLQVWLAYRAWSGLDPQRRPALVTSAYDFQPLRRRRRALVHGERIVAVSDAVKRYLMEQYPELAPETVTVIYHGADERIFPHGYRPDVHWLQKWYRQYPQLIDRHLITFPEPLVPGRGHEEFLSLMGGLRRAGVEACGLVACGEGPEDARFAERIRRQAASMDNVLITGYRDDVRNVLSISNLVVSLSPRPESFGRTALQALQLGVPLIGWNHGAVAEMLALAFSEGATPPGDVEALIAKAVELIKRPQPVSQCPSFQLSHTLDQTIGLYEQLSRRIKP